MTRPDLNHFAYYPESVIATIDSGETTSAAVDMDGTHPVAIITPAALTGTSLTFTVSHDGATYNALYDQYGTQVTVVVAASRYIPLDPATFAGIRHLKLVSGSSEAAARNIIVVGRPV